MGNEGDEEWRFKVRKMEQEITEGVEGRRCEGQQMTEEEWLKEGKGMKVERKIKDRRGRKRMDKELLERRKTRDGRSGKMKERRVDGRWRCRRMER